VKKLRTQPRKQASQARSRATVDAILEATARVLVHDGYDRASTNKVALAAGVSVGSLYQYFPNKEALVAALIERHQEEMAAVVRAALARIASSPLAVAAREVVELMLSAHAVDPKLHKVLVEQVPRVAGLERVHALEDEMLALTRAYLDAHRAELRDVDHEIAAFLVVIAIEAVTHAAVLLRPELLDKRRFVDEVTAMLVRYLER
jgi:AcrR family transcriptional regulator